MAASPDTLLQVATGGKENDLKLWDGNNSVGDIMQCDLRTGTYSGQTV